MTIFSGKESEELWRHINSACSIRELRESLYLMGCKLQELEKQLNEHRHPRMTNYKDIILK